jgi:para-nitrobenzyl esterase
MKTLAQADQEGVAFAKSAGVASLAELRHMAPGDLPRGRGWPIVDGWVIPDDQYKLYEAGKYNDVDILVGYNSDEGLSFSRERTPAEFVANVEKRYGPYAEKLLKAYPVGENTVPKTARDLIRDAAFGWQTWAWATLQARTGKSKVYYYYFDQHPQRAEGSPLFEHGTPHGVDVPYVFQTLDSNKPDLTPGDLAISETMATYWANFAKRGDPNGPGVPTWPRFNGKEGEVMYFKDQAQVGPVPSADALAVLDSYFAWRRTPEGQAWAK